MKKVVRTVWISLLSGLAFLVACVSPKGLTRAEKKQLKEERTVLINTLDEHLMQGKPNNPEELYQMKTEEYALRARLDEIYQRLGDRRARMSNVEQIGQLHHDMDSLKSIINGPKETRKREIREQLEQLAAAIQRREGACVYGSPEVIQSYGEETWQMKKEFENLKKELDALEHE